ncbi:cytochrome b [Catenovulum sp. SM1970]|uniref:cytochrome b n=1 Tax=Marinifaba aquimaris TaxID=2741323 RepID=UPI001571F228|nr:cytochrome b [Marinifaba aquimaris]NTS75588.1 cytochrome b [Marinifaba aquimaris]
MASPTSYNTTSKCLHWLTGILVLALFGLGFWMVDLSYYHAWYRTSMELHKSIGVILALLFIWRLVNRLTSTQPSPIAKQAWQKLAAHMTHLMLYVLVFSIFITGYLISTADGRSIEIFELIAIPALIAEGEQQAELAGSIHKWLAYSVIGLVVLHATAALKHHFIDKDVTLSRMWFKSKHN